MKGHVACMGLSLSLLFNDAVSIDTTRIHRR
jgi:hypothetical protein